MRLVKRSVNQDDVSAYHLFYADAVGSPGSDLTFFDWPVRPSARHPVDRPHRRCAWPGATRSPTGSTACASSGERRRSRRARRAPHARLRGPEGQRLSLVDDGGAGEAHPWDRSPVPAAHQIRGLGPVTLSVPVLGPTDTVLQQVVGMRPCAPTRTPTRRSTPCHVYETGAGGPRPRCTWRCSPGVPSARQGAGAVHHLALRCPDADYDAWAERLAEYEVPNSGPVDRYWFRSLYFREPNGILFEIATDGPGFAVDEDAATLGEKVVLAPFLEPRRAEIVANLKPID
jgi:glyoxalase family protein